MRLPSAVAALLLVYAVAARTQVPTDTWSVGVVLQDDAQERRGEQLSAIGLRLGWRAMSHGDSPRSISFPFAIAVFPLLSADRTYAVPNVSLIGGTPKATDQFDASSLLVTASMGLTRVIKATKDHQLEFGGTIVTAIISPRSGPPASFGPTIAYTARASSEPAFQVGATLLVYGLGGTHVLVPFSIVW